MSSEVYKQLLQVMKKRGGPYAGADIPEFYEMVAGYSAQFADLDVDVQNDIISRTEHSL